MKKILFSLALLVIASSAFSQNSISVPDFEVPQNSEGSMAVNFQFDTENRYVGYQFELTLPEDLSFVMEEGTDVAFEEGDCYNGHSVSATLTDGVVTVLCYSGKDYTLLGTSGTLLTFSVKANSQLNVGKTYTGTIKNISISDGNKKSLAESSFTITIGEPADLRTVLDETSTTAPEAATNVDVRVKRTIKANTWSTICLPFAMTETQVTSAFGNGAVLGDFTAWSSEEDDDGNITSISIDFTEVKAIAANHPYIIKVPEALSDFTVDGVSIDPDEEPTVQVGKKKAEKGYFIGTYVANTEVPEFNLFLSGGNFYYSSGKTKMKGYRGYFELADVLTVEDNAGARAFISFNAGDGTTKILNADFLRTKTGRVYSVTGRYMGENVNMKSLPKGVYVVDGVKVINN